MAKGRKQRKAAKRATSIPGAPHAADDGDAPAPPKSRKLKATVVSARPVIKAPEHLAPEHQRLYLLMNDPLADSDARTDAAFILLPIMHTPLPPRVPTPEEAREEEDYVRSLLEGRG
jgi:hypothetical protein